MTLSNKFQSLLRMLFLSFLYLGGSGGCSPEDEPTPSKILGEVSQALTVTAAYTYTNTSTTTVLQPVSGRKTVGTTSGLHSVWVLNGTLHYATSQDGVLWSTDTLWSGNGVAMPTIAVASDGTIGIAYVRTALGSATHGDIYYQSQTPEGVWQDAFRVTSNALSQNGTSPSIAIHNTTVHLAWSKGASVHYASFPVHSTDLPFPPVVSTANTMTPCVSNKINYPSIAVSNGVTGAEPVVRIAWYETHPASSNCSVGPGFGWLVVQKNVSSSTGVSWTTVGSTFTGTGTSPMGSAVSLSLAANQVTGDFYLATSQIVDGTGTTWLWHENAQNPSDTWQSTQILASKAIIDVVAKTRVCDPLVRIVFSDFTQGSNGYGPTFYRTGTWTGASTAPTWLTPSTMMSAMGRTGSALLWTKSTGISSMRDVYSLFESWMGSNNYVLMSAYDTKPIPSCSAGPVGPGPR